MIKTVTFTIIVAVLLLLSLGDTQIAIAQSVDPPKVNAQPAEAGAVELLGPDLFLANEFLPKVGGSTFVYQRAGRPDPFMPFLTVFLRDDEIHEREELTGLRRFEPGQLRLTAIIVGKRANVAMVEDPTGLGYILRPGTAIGRNGRVEAIRADRVIIREQDPAENQRHHTVEMILK